MVWTASRRVVIVGLTLASVSTLLLLSFSSYGDGIVSVLPTPPWTSTDQVTYYPPMPEAAVGNWTYDVERDANDYGLTGPQCRAAFPALFTELDKSIALRRNDPITLKSLNLRVPHPGQVRVLIDRGNLRIVEYGAMNRTGSRGRATLNAINRALQYAPDRSQIPNLEFIFDTEDFTGDTENFTKAEYARMAPIWTYTKRAEDDGSWLMPDFGYWSWPEFEGVGAYEEVRERIQAVDDRTAFSRKDPRLIWRGNVDTYPFVRGSLVNTTVGKEWADVHALKWLNKEDIKKNLLTMEDHCKYQFVAHTEGRSYSGRGKYLLNCKSILFTHNLTWIEPHHAAMNCATHLPDDNPYINCVQVRDDWSDLEQKIEYLIAHRAEADRIAERSARTFRDRYLTPAAETCHWRELFKGWRSVAFEPEYWSGVYNKKVRGMPWESFVLLNPFEVVDSTARYLNTND